MPSTHRPSESLDADVFTAIAHPVRRQILNSLVRHDLTVTDLAEPFEISREAG
jgi:DNA-binding transcriptional ArsR family regulator